MDMNTGNKMETFALALVGVYVAGIISGIAIMHAIDKELLGVARGIRRLRRRGW